jgi:transcriptional regulator with XRE-family HTH domain
MSRRGKWPATGFAGRLRVLREAQGISQARLADLAGCHVLTVSKIERGVHEPAWPLVLALAEALGVEVTAFLQRPPRGRPAGQGGGK